MRLIVINLDHDTDRRARVERRLAELGLRWERLSAVDGRRLDPCHEHLIDHDTNAARGLEFSPGAIGCWLSHRRAQRMVAEGVEPMALILEDDIAIADDLPNVLERIERGRRGPVRRNPSASLQDAPEVRPGAPHRRRTPRDDCRQVDPFRWDGYSDQPATLDRRVKRPAVALAQHRRRAEDR